MLVATFATDPASCRYSWSGFWLCAASVTLPTAIGLLAKETAVLLPLYALLIEWLLLGFRITTLAQPTSLDVGPRKMGRARDKHLLRLFLLVLVLPMIAGLTWLLPNMLQAARWSTRDFTLGTRLLSEARIVVDYIVWTLLPTPHALSFYHDNFNISTGLLTPWTTLPCIFALTGLVVIIWWLRPRYPLAAVGIALFLGCQSLTATVLPLGTDLRASELLCELRPAAGDVSIAGCGSRTHICGSPLRVAPSGPPRWLASAVDNRNRHDCIGVGKSVASGRRPRGTRS